MDLIEMLHTTVVYQWIENFLRAFPVVGTMIIAAVCFCLPGTIGYVLCCFLRKIFDVVDWIESLFEERKQRKIDWEKFSVDRYCTKEQRIEMPLSAILNMIRNESPYILYDRNYIYINELTNKEIAKLKKKIRLYETVGRTSSDMKKASEIKKEIVKNRVAVKLSFKDYKQYIKILDEYEKRKKQDEALAQWVKERQMLQEMQQKQKKQAQEITEKTINILQLERDRLKKLSEEEINQAQEMMKEVQDNIRAQREESDNAPSEAIESLDLEKELLRESKLKLEVY